MTMELDRWRTFWVWCLLAMLAFAGAPVAAADASTPGPSTSADDSDTLVDIPDAPLRKSVEEALGKNPGDPITRGEMATLTRLTSTNGGIRQLTGIEHAVNLTWLSLGNNQIVELDPLAGLTALTTLNLSGNEVVELEPLAGLTALTWLSLGNNQIVELDPLAGLKALVVLYLYNNHVVELEPLAGMTALKNLLLSSNQVVELDPLAGLTALTTLYLHDNQIVELDPLAGLTALTTLDLHDNQVSDLAPLADMTALTVLNLGVNQVSDLAPLADMTALTVLNLGVNQIVELDPLAELTALTTLSLNGNEVVELAPLAGLTALTTLYLHDNQVSDLAPLADMTALTSLYLGGNQIVDLDPLADMTALRRLSLGFNHVVDLAPLANMTALTDLYLMANQIVELDPLADMTALTRLSLHSNQVGDLDPLAGLTALTELDLDGNHVGDLGPLAGLTALTELDLRYNQVGDLGPLAANDGLGQGDTVDVRGNPLGQRSRETHIPTLRQRGVEVQFDDLPDLPAEMSGGLRQAVELAILGGTPFADLSVLEAANRGIENLTGIEGGTSIRVLYLDQNKITDIALLAALPYLFALTLARNMVEDLTPLAAMDYLYYLALDSNSLMAVPRLPSGLRYLYLSDNSISDIASLRDNRFLQLDMSSNSITSLAPLSAQFLLRYLDFDDNQVVDLSPLNFQSLQELRFRDNAVRDISPLLNGEKLLMVDARRNPLADDALNVLETLRERRVTVLAGETVPYFPAGGGSRQGFVRIVNRSDEDGHVFIEAVDDAGVRVPPVRLEVGARGAVHFNSDDLEYGNAAKGINGGIGAPTAGNWRLSVVSALDVEVLSYIRTEDGFVTAMHDVVPDAMAHFFNPGSNENQRSILRVVNTEAEPAKWTTGGYDDRGRWRPMAGSMLVRPQHALTLTARELEDAHGLGDGHGKWRLRTRGFPWFAMSLLESPTGHLVNLSTAPDNATPLADGGAMHRVPLFPAAGGSRQGFARVINRSYAAGEVVIEAVDDDGSRSARVRLAVGARRAVHFNSNDLEAGNAAKGLDGGVGVGAGDWRLELASELELVVLSYARTADGFLTSLHDLAPVAEDGGHRVVFFNPGSNTGQVSKLRLINNGGEAAAVTVTGIDDQGSGSGTVTLTVPAAAAVTFTSAELEAGGGGLRGRLGDGYGKWRLRVRSDEPIAVMSLLETPTGHLTNVSTGTAD